MLARRIAFTIAAVVLIAVLALTLVRRRSGPIAPTHVEGRAAPLGPPRTANDAPAGGPKLAALAA